MVSEAHNSTIDFNQQLLAFYINNRGKIRAHYNDLTRKFLAYNDRDGNPDASLRRPQFEALEMYVFIKEFLDNKQVYEIFLIDPLSCSPELYAALRVLLHIMLRQLF